MEEKLTEVQMPIGRYSLYRESDGMGDSGLSWMIFDHEKTTAEQKYAWVENSAGLVKVGFGIRVGSHYARTFNAQDWWQCSGVTEILEVNEDKTEVRFKTRNSVYVAKSF